MLNPSEKAQTYLTRIENSEFWPESLNHKKAMCFICLGDFNNAQLQFESAFSSLQKGYKFWSISDQPELLVNSCVLSGNLRMFYKIRLDLDDYFASKERPSYLDYYSLILLNLLDELRNQEVRFLISKLHNVRNSKVGVEIGNTALSIIDSNQSLFDTSLRNLIHLHKKAAQYGSLRETPDGLFSLNALSLVYCALRRNLGVNIANLFLPIEYAKYLLKEVI